MTLYHRLQAAGVRVSLDSRARHRHRAAPRETFVQRLADVTAEEAIAEAARMRETPLAVVFRNGKVLLMTLSETGIVLAVGAETPKQSAALAHVLAAAEPAPEASIRPRKRRKAQDEALTEEAAQDAPGDEPVANQGEPVAEPEAPVGEQETDDDGRD